MQFAMTQEYQVPQGYFRSKLFVLSSNTNPLLAASGPIFSLLERLNISPTLPPIDIIQNNIKHELHAFHSRLKSQNYIEEFVRIANFLLTTTIDELLGKNYLRLTGKTPIFKALTPASIDTIGPEHRFFDVVNFIKERANQYLDLLELAYFCLITGFEGHQHHVPDGRQNLDNLIEELYQIIHQHRVNNTHLLFNEKKASQHAPKRNTTIINVVACTLGIPLLFYCISHLIIEHQAKSLMNQPLLTHVETQHHG